MWERKKEPEAPAMPAASAQPVLQTRPQQTPTPVRTAATIGKGMTIIGEIHSKEDLYIDGKVQGLLDLEENTLTVGPNGQANSDIRAREVVVLGKVKGNVEASQRVAIRKDGSLIGDIRTAGIVIDDEAYFKGSIDIVRTEAKQATA